MKGREKTPILSNKNSNISFYLYKIVEQLLHLSNVGLLGLLFNFYFKCGAFFIWVFFFSCLRPQAFACLA